MSGRGRGRGRGRAPQRLHVSSKIPMNVPEPVTPPPARYDDDPAVLFLEAQGLSVEQLGTRRSTRLKGGNKKKSDGKAITMTGLDFEVQPNDSAVASGQDRPDNNAIISEEIQPNDNAIASDQDRPNDNGMLFEEAQPNDNPLAPNQDQPNDTAMISEDVQPNDNTIASNQRSPNDNADASAPEGIPEGEPSVEEISKAKRGKMKRGAKKVEVKPIAEADASLALVPVTKKKAPALVTKKRKPQKPEVSTSHSAPEADDNSEASLIVRCPATISDYNRITELMKQSGGLFDFLDNNKSNPESAIDWNEFQTGKIWTPRSGPPSSLARQRLENLAQFINYTVISIAHDDRISKEKAWELTGLLKVETRGINMFNAFSHWRAGQLTTANDGVPVPDARDRICREWREMSKEDQLEVFKKIEREELRSQKDEANDALSLPENRYKYLEEQTDIFQRLAAQLNVRSDLITLGLHVLPGSSSNPPLTSTFASTVSSVRAVAKFDAEIQKIVKYLLDPPLHEHEQDEDGAGAEVGAKAKAKAGAEDAKPKASKVDDPYVVGPDGWIVYNPKLYEDTRGLSREIIHRMLSTRLKNVIRQGPIDPNAKEDFPWQVSNVLCIKKRLVLCGWILKKFFPGCVGPGKDGESVRWSLKRVGKVEARALLLKYNNDRNPDKTHSDKDLTRLQYISTESLYVTKEGRVFEMELGGPEELDGAVALTAYPENDRPIIVTAKGEVILTIGEYKAEEDRKNGHKKTMESARDAFNSDDDEESAKESDEKTTAAVPATSADVAKVMLPALKFADGRGSIVLIEKAGTTQSTKARKEKKSTYQEIDSEIESDAQKPAKKGKKSSNMGEGQKKTATASASKKRARSDSSEPDAVDDDKEEKSAKKVRR